MGVIRYTIVIEEKIPDHLFPFMLDCAERYKKMKGSITLEKLIAEQNLLEADVYWKSTDIEIGNRGDKIEMEFQAIVLKSPRGPIDITHLQNTKQLPESNG